MKKSLLMLVAAAAFTGCSKTQDAQPLAVVVQNADATITTDFGTVQDANLPYFMMNNFWNKSANGAGTQSSYYNNINSLGASATHRAGTGNLIKVLPGLGIWLALHQRFRGRPLTEANQRLG